MPLAAVPFLEFISKYELMISASMIINLSGGVSPNLYLKETKLILDLFNNYIACVCSYKAIFSP